MEPNKNTKTGEKIGKPAAIAILVILVFLMIACIRLQMELNDLREKYKDLDSQRNELRLDVEELEYLRDLQENDPEAFNEYMAKLLGYYDPSSTVYSNGTVVEK